MTFGHLWADFPVHVLSIMDKSNFRLLWDYHIL